MKPENEQSGLAAFGKNTLLGFASTLIAKICLLPIDVYQGLIIEMTKGKVDTSSFTKNIQEMATILKHSQGPSFVKSIFLNGFITSYKTQAFNFGFYYTLNQMLKLNQHQNDKSATLNFAKSFLSGSFAGVATLGITYPFSIIGLQYAQYRHQSQGQLITFAEFAKQYIKSVGLLPIYQGSALSIPGIIVYRGFYFGLYNSLKPLIPKNDNGSLFLLGCFSTFIGITASAPFDYLRRFAMMESSKFKRYVGGIEAFKTFLNATNVPLFNSPPLVPRLLSGSLYLIAFDKITNYLKDDTSLIDEQQQTEE